MCSKTGGCLYRGVNAHLVCSIASVDADLNEPNDVSCMKAIIDHKAIRERLELHRDDIDGAAMYTDENTFAVAQRLSALSPTQNFTDPRS